MSYRLTKAQQALMTPGECTACGLVVSYDRNSAGECTACHNAGYERRRAERKAQLAAMARCEIDGCQSRGTWEASGVLLCGRHLSKVKRAHSRAASNLGGIGLFMPVVFGRDDVLFHASN